MKSIDNSSKSTPAKSKNILAAQNVILIEKRDSDLINLGQIVKEHSQEKLPKEGGGGTGNDSSFEFEKMILKKKKSIFTKKNIKLILLNTIKRMGRP